MVMYDTLPSRSQSGSQRLRKKCTETKKSFHTNREKGPFRVAKNSLAKIAANKTAAEPLEELFNGPTAIAFSDELTSSPKIIVDFAKDHEKLSIVGGLMDGKLIDSEVIKQLAALPSMDELRSKIIGVLNAPATKVAGILNRPGGQLAQVLSAKSQQEETA